MGVNISDIIPRKEIEVSELKGKVLAIDAFNTLYQFMSSIRQMDGTPLMNKDGKITSHLSGLFYRNINLLQEGIKPVYVFDGKPPELKQATIDKRKEAKADARSRYHEAKEAGDEEKMRKFASRTVSITQEVIDESKVLLKAMGLPVVQAPGEGEAEAAVLARAKKVWAAASQDYDSLLYATPYLVRNLTLARRKKTSAGLYVETKPELIEFEEVTTKLGIDRDQLICLAILVGTDYNLGGVKGLGQKKALELVQRHKFPVEIFDEIKKSSKYELTFDWKEIFQMFHEYETDMDGELVFRKVDEAAVKKILLANDFSEGRIDSGLRKLKDLEESKKQRGLGDFF